MKFSISDVWSRQLFVALCRRYGLRPFRYRRMHRQSIIIRAPKSFVEQVLWPEFEELSAALTAYLSRDHREGDPRGGTRRDRRGRGSRRADGGSVDDLALVSYLRSR